MPGKRTPEQQRERMRAYRARQRAAAASVDPSATVSSTVSSAVEPEPSAAPGDYSRHVTFGEEPPVALDVPTYFPPLPSTYRQPRGQELVQPVDPQPEPPLRVLPVMRTRAEKWADLQAAGGTPTAPPPAPKPRPAGASAPVRKPVRVVKTPDEALSAIRRERAGNALPEPLPGECMCGAGRPHRHYFDGWVAGMTDAQRHSVSEALGQTQETKWAKR